MCKHVSALIQLMMCFSSQMVNALSQKKDKFLETWDRAKRLENWLFSTTAQELPRLKVKWDGGGS